MIVSAIAAVAENGIIGRSGDLPWRLPDDMKFFQATTLGHPVIMGRKNWESIPLKYRPLKERMNIVVTRDPGYNAPEATVCTSLQQALDTARATGTSECFVIGGGEIYREAFRLSVVDRVYLTTVHAHVEGDVHFPTLGDRWKEQWREFHAADARHAYAFTFRQLER